MDPNEDLIEKTLELKGELEEITKRLEQEKTKEFKQIDESSEVKEEPKQKQNKNAKWLLPVIISVSILVIAAILYFFVFQLNVKPGIYTVKEVDTAYTYNTKGYIIGSDENIETYTLEESDDITFKASAYPAVDDVILKDDVLFTYDEISLGDDYVVSIKPSSAGIVTSASSTTTIVRTGISYKEDISTGVFPQVGACAIIRTYLDGGSTTDTNAIVTNVSLHATPNSATITFGFEETPDVRIKESNTNVVYYQSQALSEMYGCEDIYMSGGQIVVPGQGQTSPAIISDPSTPGYTITTNSYNNELPESKVPGDTYRYVTKSINLANAEDLVTTSTSLYNWTYKKIVTAEKTLKSMVDGVVKSVTLNTEDGIFTIEIYGKENNLLAFDITEEYIDKIALEQSVTIENEDTEIIDTIDTIEDMVANIINANFKNYNIGDEFDITVKGSGEKVLLVPKTYINEGKVKLIKAETTEEIEIEYEDYNEENYKILSGLEVGDKIEEYIE